MFNSLKLRSIASLTLCCIGFSCLPIPIFGATPRNTSSSTSLSKAKIGSDAWIEQKVRQYPELLWLTEPSSLSSSLAMPEGAVFSPYLFGKKLPAFDMAMRSMIYLHLLLQGARQAYSQFVQLQPNTETLSFKQFQTAHKQLLFFVNSPKNFDNTVKVLETAIVLKYLGCSAKAASLFKPYFSDAQVGSFYTKALHVLQTFPELCPSFARLSPEQKELFLSLRRLTNYDDLFQLTDSPSAKFLSLGRIKKPLTVLDLYLYSLDVYGANNCSQAFYEDFSPLLVMLQQHATVEEAFSRYLTFRANKLGFEGLSRTDMALVRLATLMELSPVEASMLSASFKNIPGEDADILLSSFFSPQGEHLPLTVKGLPQLLSGLQQANLGNTVSTPEEKAKHVYVTALTLLIKGLRAHKEMLTKRVLSQSVILDFSDTVASCGGLDLFSENASVRIHLNGAVSVHI